MDLNDKQLYLYFLRNYYEIDTNKITDFELTDESCKFRLDETNFYDVNRKTIDELIDKIRTCGKKERRNRIGIILSSEVIEYFLSRHHEKYRMFINFISMINDSGYGVDIITDKNIANIMPEDVKQLDISLFFNPTNDERNSITENLRESIELHYRRHSIQTRRYLANFEHSLIALNLANIPNEKKMLLVHTQYILNYPYSDSIRDNDESLFRYIDEIEKVNYDIAVTSEKVLDMLKKIYPTKIYKLFDEPGYSIEQMKESGFLYDSIVDKNKMCVKYTGEKDLLTVINVCKPLSYSMAILSNNKDDILDIKEIMEENNYDKYYIIDDKYTPLLSDYKFYTDFSTLSESYKINDMVMIFSNENKYNDDDNKKIYFVDKTNPISIIKIILFNQGYYNENENTSTFTYGISDDNKATIKEIFK